MSKSNFSFADFVIELKEKASDIAPKPVEQREERKYFLIVCEGEKTEPNYFKYFKNKLPKNLVSTIELVGLGDNTLNVVNKAIEERDRRLANPVAPNYDEVWAIFDKDDFPDDRFNLSIQQALNGNISCGYSNQAFELWYVLHFQYLDANLHRSQYFSILSKITGKKYEKNSDEMVEFIFENGDIDLAISSAKKLELIHSGKSPSDSVPYTSVYKIVELLLKYCN